MVSIRIGTRADLADVTALEAGQDTAAWLGKTGLDWHERALADPGQEHLIAEDDGRLAGRCIRQNMESSADGVGTVLNGTYRDLLSAIAECGATLTGLLFVAMTVAARRGPSDRPAVIQQVREAAAILAFTNALAVSLFGLVPGTDVGYPAIVVAVIGIFFTAAGARSIFSGHLARRHVPRQLGLIALLLAIFVFELGSH
jgi:hypothetical protein